ncbi:MAG: 4-carboxy-4-hydroxy-2-oxoadipate aldolase/oxaloacetate decarboxylase [Desulfobacterales bacterium]|nr:MAG: 4-carboxy-4-hydroxy-2-oxoadipate aldolase/oxaloacetate decarboxylase [Desulfobacterales bacterium]
MKIFNVDFTRPDAEIIKAFAKIPTPTISDAMGRCGAMSSDMKPVFPGARVCSSAFTVRIYANDNLMLHLALKEARPGDILVVDSRGYTECALWGELMSLCARYRGLGGTVIDGGVRDKDAIAELSYPVFSKTIIPVGTHKSNQGAICKPVSCDGVPVFPGDIIVGDSDGVVVVPLDQARVVLEKARAILDREDQMRARIEKGELIFDILELEKYFQD